jgi:hypothetical protein
VEVDVRDWLPLMGVALEDGVIEEILTEAEVVLRRFIAEEGDGVVFASPAVLATAGKPELRVTGSGRQRSREPLHRQ